MGMKVDSTIKENKSAIRKRILACRDAISEDRHREFSDRIIKQLCSLEVFTEASILLSYVNFRSEVATQGLIRQELRGDKYIFVPVVKGSVMELVHLNSLDELQSGYQGILEPLKKTKEVFDSSLLPAKVVAIIPGSVYDMKGTRLGYGKGYYDRFLNQYPDILRIGLGFECQILKDALLPRQEHDIRMDYLISEERIYCFDNEQ